MSTLFYKRATFVTHLPTGYLYSPSHFWLAPETPGAVATERTPGRWRVGFTKFATRMLGEMVDHQWEKQPGEPVASGEIIGSIEGFKAVSDLYCVLQGTFAGGNPELAQHIDKVGAEPYGAGWLYMVEGVPDAHCLELDAYRTLLDATIDRILAKQQAAEELP